MFYAQGPADDDISKDSSFRENNQINDDQPKVELISKGKLKKDKNNFKDDSKMQNSPKQKSKVQ